MRLFKNGSSTLSFEWPSSSNLSARFDWIIPLTFFDLFDILCITHFKERFVCFGYFIIVISIKPLEAFFKGHRVQRIDIFGLSSLHWCLLLKSLILNRCFFNLFFLLLFDRLGWLTWDFRRSILLALLLTTSTSFWFPSFGFLSISV